MADQPSPDTDTGPDRKSATGTPRWVKVFGVITLALILLLAIAMLTGIGGRHGPGRHAPSGHATPSSVSVTESGGFDGHTPPAGGHKPS